MSDLAVTFEDAAERAGWTRLPNVVLLDPRLSAPAVRVYALLRFFARRQDVATVGQERMAAHLGVTDRTLRSYITELVAADLVLVQRRGRGLTNMHVIRALTGKNLPPGSEDLFRSGRKPASGEVEEDEVEVVEVEKGTRAPEPLSDQPELELPDGQTASDVYERLFDLARRRSLAQKAFPTRKGVRAALERHADKDVGRTVGELEFWVEHGNGKHEQIKSMDGRLETFLRRADRAPAAAGNGGGKYDRIVN